MVINNNAKKFLFWNFFRKICQRLLSAILAKLSSGKEPIQNDMYEKYIIQ